MTKNGFWSWYTCRAMLIDRSCIASKSADCVFGVARLISSARQICVNSGPFWNWNSRWPDSSSTIMFVPKMSAGIRSGVNWIRENSRFSVWASVRTSSVLPSPGTPSNRQWPPTNKHVSTPCTTSPCPTITRESCL